MTKKSKPFVEKCSIEKNANRKIVFWKIITLFCLQFRTEIDFRKKKDISKESNRIKQFFTLISSQFEWRKSSRI